MEIFLSYNWSDKVQADQIEDSLSSIGLTIIRDVNEIKYKDSLAQFMQRIREADYAIILISIDYLKSPNCLNELIELSKEKEFDKKILPIIIDNQSIYKPEDRFEIVKYWDNKYSNLEKLINAVNPTNAISLIQELKHYKTILSSIDEFIKKIISGLNVTFSNSIKNNFEDILSFIGFDKSSIQNELVRIKEIRNLQLKDLELEKLQKKYPKSEDVLFSIGYINLTEIKNYHRAKEAFKKYLENYNQTSFIALNNLGLSCFNLGEIDEADRFYEKGLTLNPNAYQIFHNLGNLEAKKKNYSKAKEYFLKTIALYPFDAETFFNVGKIYSDFEHNYDKGIEYYNKAIELEPDFYMAYNNLAGIYLRLKDFTSAMALLETGLSKNPEDFVTTNNLAVLYETINKDYTKAKSYFRKSIRLNQNYTSPKIGLAKLLILHFNEVDEALELFEDVIAIEPSNDEVLFQISLLYLTLNKKEKAKEYYDRACAINLKLKNINLEKEIAQ